MDNLVTVIKSTKGLFWEKGYDGTSVKDIAITSGFEPGNFYNYFLSKEEVLFEAMKYELGKFIAAITKRKDFNKMRPIDRLKLIIKSYLHIHLSGKRPFLYILDVELRSLSTEHRLEIVRIRDTYEGILREVIRAGIDSGEFREVDEKIYGFVILSILARVRLWYSPYGKLSRAQITDSIFDFILKGIEK